MSYLRLPEFGTKCSLSCRSAFGRRNIADSEQSSHSPGHSHQAHVEQAEKSVTKVFIGEKENIKKEKLTTRRNDRHNTTSGIQCLYQISKS